MNTNDAKLFCCRRSDLSLYYDPFELEERILLEVSNDEFSNVNLNEMESKCGMLLSTHPPLSGLEIRCYSRDIGMPLWKEFCKVVGRLTSKQATKAIDIYFPSYRFPVDQRESFMNELILHLPGKNLYKLHIRSFPPNCPLKDSNAFPLLEELVIRGTMGWASCLSTTEAAEDLDLGQALRNLPALRRFELHHYDKDFTIDLAQSIINALQSNPNLEKVHVEWSSHCFKEGDKLAMQFAPRIQQAKKVAGCTKKRVTTTEEFVKAIICVRDRVDCLDYFFAQVDPNVYAQAAVAAGSTMKKVGEKCFDLECACKECCSHDELYKDIKDFGRCWKHDTNKRRKTQGEEERSTAK